LNQLLLFNGANALGLYDQLILRKKLSEIQFYLFEKIMENLYSSFLSPFIPSLPAEGSTKDLRFVYFNLYFICKQFHGDCIPSRNFLPSIQGLNDMLEEKIQNIHILNVKTEKNLVFIIRTPEDLLTLENGEIQNYLKMFQKAQQVRTAEKDHAEGQQNIQDNEPALFGRYELLHGEYSSSTRSSLTDFTKNISSDRKDPKKRVFRSADDLQNPNSDESFCFFVQLAMSYSVITLDSDSTLMNSTHCVIDIISTSWIGGKNFEIVFQHEGKEIILKHTNLLSSQIEEFPSIPDFIAWKQDKNYDVINRIESSLPKDVRLRFLPDRNRTIALGLQKKSEGYTLYTEVDVTSLVKPLSLTEQTQAAANKIIILDGPLLTLVEWNTIHIQAVIQGEGALYCSIYELPLGMNYDTFSSFAYNYRNKLVQIQKTQERKCSTMTATKASFCFENLTASCMYGIVLDTEQSLELIATSKALKKIALSDLQQTGTEMDSSSLLHSKLSRLAIAKTLPSFRSESQNCISSFFFSGLSLQDFHSDTFKNVKLLLLNQNMYRMSTNQFIGLFYSRGLLLEKDNESLEKPNGILKDITQPVLVNTFKEIDKLFDCKLQEPFTSSFSFTQNYPQEEGYPLEKLDINLTSRNNNQFYGTIPQMESVSMNIASSFSKSEEFFYVKYDQKFIYLIPKYQNDYSLLEMINFIESNLLRSSDSNSSSTANVLVVCNTKFIVDVLFHDVNTNEWLKESHLKSSKYVIIRLFQVLLSWSMKDVQNEVVLLSVGLVPEITSIMISYYLDGGVFYSASPGHNNNDHQHDDNQSLNSFFTQQHVLQENDSGVGNAYSKLVETSVVNRQNSIYLYIFPIYQYNPLSVAPDSDEEDDDEDDIGITGSPLAISTPFSTAEKFLQFPSQEIKLTTTILCKVLSNLETKTNENLVLIKPFSRIYGNSQTLKLKEPVTFHIDLFYHFKPQQSSFMEENPSYFESSQQSYANASSQNQESSSYKKPQLKLIIRPILDDIDIFQISFGPIVGRITSADARIMFEFNTDLAVMECILMPTNIQMDNFNPDDPTAGTESLRIVCRKEKIQKYAPVVFTFQNLTPDTRYNVMIPSLFPNKIFTTIRTNPLIVLQTEVMFVGSHRYQNVSIVNDFLYQFGNYQFPNVPHLNLLMNADANPELTEKVEIPNVFDLIQNNLIKTNQFENILVVFHLDSMTFFTHYYPLLKEKCFYLVKNFLLFEALKKSEILEEENAEEGRKKAKKEKKKFKKKLLREGLLSEEEANEEENEEVIKLFDETLDKQISASYFQQIIEIMNDTIRILWSHPDVTEVFSKCCHIPLFHSEYLLPASSSSSSSPPPTRPSSALKERMNSSKSFKTKNNPNTEIRDDEIESFIRTQFENQVQSYISELYGMDLTNEKKNKSELKSWKLGALLIILLDIVRGRTKLKGSNKKESNIQENEEEGDEQEAPVDEMEKKEGEEGEEQEDVEGENKLASSPTTKSPKKQPEMEEEDEGEGKKSLFSFGFIEKNQWKLIRKLCVDDKLTQLIIAIEKPLISLTGVPAEFDLSSFDNRLPKGNIIPFQPTVADLEIFLQYWIDWIAKIRNISNGIESRSVLFVSKSDVAYSTVIQDLKTGIKVNQVCVGNYNLGLVDESNPPPNNANPEDYVMSGKIGTLKYIHTFKNQDYARLTAFETEANRQLKKKLKFPEVNKSGKSQRKSSIQKLDPKEAKKSKNKNIQTVIDGSMMKREVESSALISLNQVNNANNNEGTKNNNNNPDAEGGNALVSKTAVRQYARNIAGNVGYAQLKLWIDRWNPVCVWTNIDMNAVHTNQENNAGGGGGKSGQKDKKGLKALTDRKTGAGKEGEEEDFGLTADKRKQMEELIRQHKREEMEFGLLTASAKKETKEAMLERHRKEEEALGLDPALKEKIQEAQKKKRKKEEEEDEEDHEDAIMVFGPIVGAPLIVDNNDEVDDGEQEEEQRPQSPAVGNNKKERDEKASGSAKKKNILIKIPIMIELDRPGSLAMLVSPLFQKKQLEVFVKDIPGMKPFTFELGPLQVEERYQVNILQGIKPSPYNSFIISTHYHWEETNVIIVNCELPDPRLNLPKTGTTASPPASGVQEGSEISNNKETTNTAAVVQPSPMLMVELFKRCMVPFHGIQCIIHNNFQPNFDYYIDNNCNSIMLKVQLCEYAKTKKISPELRSEINVIINYFRSVFRDNYSRPSYRELLKSAMNMLIPQSYSIYDYLQENGINSPLKTGKRKGGGGLRGMKSKLKSAMNKSFSSPAGVDEITPAKVNSKLLFQLIEQRMIQEYIEQLRYPNANIYRAVLDTENTTAYQEYQKITHQFFKQTPSTNRTASSNTLDGYHQNTNEIQDQLTEQFQQLYQIDHRKLIILQKQYRQQQIKFQQEQARMRRVSQTATTQQKEEQRKFEEQIASLYSKRFLLIWSDPVDDPVEAILKQWNVGALPAPVQWLPYYSINEKISIECASVIQSLIATPRVNPSLEMAAQPARSKSNYQLNTTHPKYSSNHTVDEDNHRYLNALHAINKQPADLNKSVIRMVIVNNKRFFSSVTHAFNRFSKTVLEKLLSENNILNYPEIIFTNLLKPPPTTAASSFNSPSMLKKVTSNFSSVNLLKPAEGENEEESPSVSPSKPENSTNHLINPYQQCILQLSLLVELLEEWKNGFFGREYLLVCPVQYSKHGTSKQELPYLLENDLDIMLSNQDKYENQNSLALKYGTASGRKTGNQSYIQVLIEGSNNLMNPVRKVNFYLLDSVYRSNEYERNMIMSERRLTMPKKKVNASMNKSKRAQKKKQEEEAKQMQLIMNDLEEIIQRQLPDGYLLVHCLSTKVFTEITKVNKKSNTMKNFFTNEDEKTKEQLENEQNNKEIKSPRIFSLLTSPREEQKRLEEEQAKRKQKEEEEREAEKTRLQSQVAASKEIVMDMITTMNVQILGDKLPLQRQYEIAHPRPLPEDGSLIDPTTINPEFEESYQMEKFTLLQLPEWFLALFPTSETNFIEDDLLFLLKQHTKIAPLMELLEIILSSSSSSISQSLSSLNNSEESRAILPSLKFYEFILKEYEFSRLYELSLPEDLREVDFRYTGNLSIFFKDFVGQIWYGKKRRNVVYLASDSSSSSAANQKDEAEQAAFEEKSKKFNAATTSGGGGGENEEEDNEDEDAEDPDEKRKKSTTSRKEQPQATTEFIFSNDMKHYMLNFADDFIRSFCFSKAFHQITFENVLPSVQSVTRGGGNDNNSFNGDDNNSMTSEQEKNSVLLIGERLNLVTQEQIQEYLNSNREKFANYYHHSHEIVLNILSSRNLFMKSIFYAIYYCIVMKIGKTITSNEKYQYLFKRKDFITLLVDKIEASERKMFLAALSKDKEVLEMQAADRLLKQIQEIPVTAKEKKMKKDKEEQERKEKEKELEAKRKKRALKYNLEEGANQQQPQVDDDDDEVLLNNDISGGEGGGGVGAVREKKQFLSFMSPEEEQKIIDEFTLFFEEQFNSDLLNISYTVEEYGKHRIEDYSDILLSPRTKDNLLQETENLLEEEKQQKMKEVLEKQVKQKEAKIAALNKSKNPLQDLTEDELKEKELSLFQELSEEQLRDFQIARNKTVLDAQEPLLDRIMDLVIKDSIEVLTSQLVQENILYPDYNLSEENRRLKARIHVQRVVKQKYLQRKKFGKRITFLQFK
jgi:hypothetical protein